MTRALGRARARVGLVAVSVVVLGLLVPAAASAATFTVNTTADNAPNGSECMGVAGDCSLRQAIDQANMALSGATTINFNVPMPSTISLSNKALLVSVSRRVTIIGPGANELTVDNIGAAPNGGVFVFSNSAPAAMSGLTVTGGNINTTLAGAGIDYYGTGVLTLDGVVVSGNTASNVNGGAGGVRQDGLRMTIKNSTISGNSVSHSGGDNAGGIYNNFSALTLINTTVADNTVTAAGSGSYPDGGGIVNSGAALTTVNATIAGNSADNGAGGVSNSWAFESFMLANTIIATNSGGIDCAGPSGTFTSQGYNLIGNGSGCGFTAGTGDRVGTSGSPISPMLDALGDNGGPTPTMALQTGSPAIDAGDPAPVSDASPPGPPSLIPCPTTDQRGMGRPDVAGTACDIGAFEYQSASTADKDLALTGTPGNITTTATVASGALVSYNPPAAIDEGGEMPAVSCDHPSGSTFPVGQTKVTCTATDADDSNSPVSQSFSVTVTDSDLALQNVPANITTNATSPSGTVVTYTPPAATDEGGQTPPVSCNHPSGSTFPIGTTTVTCSASATDGDDANSPVAASFTVHVKGAAEQLSDLASAVTGVGPGTSLADKVASVQSYLAAGDTSDTCGTLRAFINQVKAQTGKSIPAATATTLIATAQRIEAVIPCTSGPRRGDRPGQSGGRPTSARRT